MQGLELSVLYISIKLETLNIAQAVGIKFVKRATKKRLKNLRKLGIVIRERGKVFKASETWCWKLLIVS